MPSSTSLRQVAQQPNPSSQRLSAPLPALDEDHALGQVSTNTSKSDPPRVEPSRLRKVKSAVLTSIPFWGHKETQTQAQVNAGVAGQQNGNESMDYTSDMVDVLDTLGTFLIIQSIRLSTNNIRPRGCDPHFPDQRPKLALHSQPPLAQPSTNLQPPPPAKRDGES
jgi:hypothetical protein